MSVVINTNVDSLKIQNVLTNATSNLSKTMQRMSNGLKINQAKDDAAGTVISERMQVQLGGNKICQNNIQNANALLSTTEGNIDVVLDNITRIRDLTLQAKNGTYSKEEKQAMQDEVSQRIAEINRVSDSAKFSQLQLFGEVDANGDAAGLNKDGATFQVGANSEDFNTINITNDDNVFSSIKFTDLLKHDKTTPAKKAVTLAEIGISLSGGVSTKDKITSTDGSGALCVAANKDKIYYSTTDNSFYKIAEQEDEDGNKSYVAEKQTQVKVAAGVDSAAVTGAPEASSSASKLGAIQAIKDSEGNIKDYYVCTASVSDEKESPTFTNTWAKITSKVGEDQAATEESTAEVQYYDSDADFDLTAMVAGDADTVGSYGQAIESLDAAIDNLTTRKAAIGSLESRMDSALDTLVTQYTNLSSAKSIITDADIASEASYYTQQQILQQVSTSLLAQANQAPMLALSLL